MLRSTLIIGLWTAATASAGYTFCHVQVNSIDAVGYEATWKFQLLVFCVTRLPLFAVGLALVLYLNRRLMNRTPKR